jgi:hypothetical protein
LLFVEGVSPALAEKTEEAPRRQKIADNLTFDTPSSAGES